MRVSLLDREDKIVLALLLPIAVVVGAIYRLAADSRRSYEETCNRLLTIARDPQKVAYVQDWAAARTKDRQFLAEAQQYPWFDPRDPSRWHYIDLDWDYLGLYVNRARLDFNGGDPFNIEKSASALSTSVKAGPASSSGCKAPRTSAWGRGLPKRSES
jgi:hypothetical protein